MQDKILEQALLKARMENNPSQFMHLLSQAPEALVFSAQFARDLDSIEPLPLNDLFEKGPMTAMAGHSLGTTFMPTRKRINDVMSLQTHRLHEGHFPDTCEEGGNWYRCDEDPKSIAAMRSMIGHFEEGEFIFSHKGLSDFLGELIPTFYDPYLDDWARGQTSICFLGKEFLSDQKVIETTLIRALNKAISDRAFEDRQVPTVRSLMLGIQPNADGLYNEQTIINFVRQHAHKIQILHLSDIVFSTGQRLNLQKILSDLQDVISKHQIIVGLDLAHTIGNRPIDLPGLNITYAVMCSYKYVSGSAGTGSGLYVSNKADLKRHQPIQGWVAVEDPSKAFEHIDGENPDNAEPVKMCDRGAVAFRRSNPSPIGVAALQEYAKVMDKKGWDNIVAKSECLTRYMIFLLQHFLGDQVHIITPEDPEKRGAMIVFQIRGLPDVKPIEHLLKQSSQFGIFDSDTRPPKNVRLTPHPGYSNFESIFYVVSRLTEVVQELLAKQAVSQKSTPIKDAGNLLMFSPPEKSKQVSVNPIEAEAIQAKL